MVIFYYLVILECGSTERSRGCQAIGKYTENECTSLQSTRTSICFTGTVTVVSQLCKPNLIAMKC